MRQNRQPNEVRKITITPNFSTHAEGSVWLEWGKNKLLATVTIEENLPPHLRYDRSYTSGWLTAEYAMLPRSTETRVKRERLYSGGRTQEIQRLLGRAFRSVVDLSLFPKQTLTVDIDIIQADGGTRCAAIVAGYAALFNVADKLIELGKIDEWPLRYELGAVSIGIVAGKTLIDLEFSEDTQAELDINVIATADGKIIEIQGGSEEKPVEAETYVQLIAQGITAVQSILEVVRSELR